MSHSGRAWTVVLGVEMDRNRDESIPRTVLEVAKMMWLAKWSGMGVSREPSERAPPYEAA